MPIVKACQPIELIVADVDGVLTDGGILFDNDGVEIKRFHIRDGQGIKLWQKAGGKFALVTGRNSHIVSQRASELDISIVRQGTEQKLAATREIAAEFGLSSEQVCYIGDDLPDLPAVRFAGFGVAVADACAELKQAADHVTDLAGGHGAVRELIELILRSQHRWDDLIQRLGH